MPRRIEEIEHIKKAEELIMSTTLKRAALAIGMAAATIAITTGGATAYNSRVKKACKNDFYRFCPSYKVGSSQLKACMRSAGGNVSSRCIDALADSGEISRRYHSRKRS